MPAHPASPAAQPPPRNAVVTGAGGGLGRALVRQLARQGWQVALVDRDAEAAAHALQELRDAGGTGFIHIMDVANPENWATLRRSLGEIWGQLDLLVNNAGLAAVGEVDQLSVAAWQRSVEVNLLGAVYGCRELLPWLKSNPAGGQILNVSSLAATAGAPAMAAYNATKAGLMAFSETLYAELRGTGVGVTVLCPGFFPTNLVKNGEFTDERHRWAALRRMELAICTADDVAAAALRGVRRGKLYVFYPWRARWIWRLKRLLPESFARLAGAAYRHTLRTAPHRPPADGPPGQESSS